jgi:A/G-specific adenine glycosylase
MTILPLISPRQIATFQGVVWDFYRANKRAMHWRAEPTPYYVLVSEMMLQQTQVTRVQQKFASFIRRFPTVQDLAAAPLSDVLEQWSGLGYNRRAKFLWQAAGKIVQDFGGDVPSAQEALMSLPGIGPNTAGAILAYAFNEPVVFVETNIRTVYIHHFFADHPNAVADTQLRHVIALTVPPENPREWYWALMDYGTHLKSTVGSQLERVKNYRQQTRFEGSRRQVRGKIVKLLLQHGRLSQDELAAFIADDRVAEVCAELVAENLIRRRGSQLHLTDS